MRGRIGILMLIAVMLAEGGRASGPDDVAALVGRAESLRSQQQFAAAIEVLQQAIALRPTDLRVALLLAETLGWDQRFRESESVYRQILRREPESREASIGLAHTLLWQGHNAAARSLFRSLARRNPSDVDAAEGAATAAYWAGDWATAQHEFAAVLRSDAQRPSARKSLAEIEAATRGENSVAIETIDDDQPFRSLHTEAVESFYSDPLTRWSMAVGGYAFRDRRRDRDWTAPSIRVSNRVAFPWQRLTVDSSIGMLRYGDGSTRALGALAVHRTIGKGELIASLDRHELVATATARAFHPAIASWSLGWHRERDPQRVLAVVDAGALRYNDHNRGWFAQGYALIPVLHRDGVSVAAGGALVARDTSESRFYVESVSSTRSADGSFFNYSYRGSYTPYWTPQRLRELRAIVKVSADLPRAATLILHADGGVAADVAQGFAPAAGPSPFPPVIATYDFDRHFHPWRASATFSVPFEDSLHLELGFEQNTTAFYRARSIRATLVRRR